MKLLRHSRADLLVLFEALIILGIVLVIRYVPIEDRTGIGTLLAATVSAMATMTLAFVAWQQVKISRLQTRLEELKTKPYPTILLGASRHEDEVVGERAEVTVIVKNDGEGTMYVNSIGIQGMWLDSEGESPFRVTDFIRHDYEEPVPVKPDNEYREVLFLSLLDWPEGDRPPGNSLSFTWVSGIVEYRGMLDEENQLKLSDQTRIN